MPGSRNRLSVLLPVLVLGLTLLGAQARATGRPADAKPFIDEKAVAAFLFTYEIRAGMTNLFEEGYQRHLEWHRQAQDPLGWYGWIVLTGEHPGRFVDGTFGLLFGAFDGRIDPLGDRADARLHVAPFAEPVSRRVLRRRPELGVGPTWESQTPSPMLEVTRFTIAPGYRDDFEEAVRTWRDQVAAISDNLSITWYELVVGGDPSSYLRVTPRHSWSEYDRSSPPRFELPEAVASASSEMWGYRPDLSTFPSRSD